MSVEDRWRWIDAKNAVHGVAGTVHVVDDSPRGKELNLSWQCKILGLARSSFYYRPVVRDGEDVMLMNLIDEEYTRHPFYGSRKMVVFLNHQGYSVNRKRIQRLMRQMGIQGICPGPNTSRRRLEHTVYPYLLKNLLIKRPDQVWSADITYIRLLRGFVYLVAILDWFSRYVLAWRLSNSLETAFCTEALEAALELGRPDIFNTDQGCQFTSVNFTKRLQEQEIRISMDSRGRAFDNIFNERLWRSVKYEDVYLKNYQTMIEAQAGLKHYFRFYNNERYHQSLDYRTPSQVHREDKRDLICMNG